MATVYSPRLKSTTAGTVINLPKPVAVSFPKSWKYSSDVVPQRGGSIVTGISLEPVVISFDGSFKIGSDVGCTEADAITKMEEIEDLLRTCENTSTRIKTIIYFDDTSGDEFYRWYDACAPKDFVYDINKADEHQFEYSITLEVTDPVRKTSAP